MKERQKMNAFDWFIGAGLLAVGLYLGVAIGELLSLDGMAFWGAILYILVPFTLVFVLILLADRVIERGIWKAFTLKPSRPLKKPAPLALLMSLPLGLLIGVVGAPFGLTELLL